VATRFKRKHNPPAATVLSTGHRSVDTQSSKAERRRKTAQQTTMNDAGIRNTRRAFQFMCCVDWLRSLHSRHSLHLHVENTRSQPLASTFFKLPNLVCGRSKSPQTALHVKMCMAQHLLLPDLGVECHERPKGDLQPFTAMLRCGPSERTFAARAKFDDGRTHSVQTNRTCAGAANAHAANARNRIAFLWWCSKFRQTSHSDAIQSPVSKKVRFN
jgi:hypothetical protein